MYLILQEYKCSFNENLIYTSNPQEEAYQTFYFKNFDLIKQEELKKKINMLYALIQL